jgi:multiple sugar transport system ATP-binding protein
MPGVELKGLSKVYARGQRAVDAVDLDIRDGELLVLVGPSGCGKSTILRMIAGLEDATSGDIRIGERRVNDVPPRDRDIAMVFQNYALYPHLSVFENMAFGLRRRHVTETEIQRRVMDTAQSLDMVRYLQRRPRDLSGGERQRVALGRAMVREPHVFLFDEPLSNLDARLRVQMRGEIKRLHQRVKATMIYVTHDQVEAMTLGDRIAVLRTGVLQQVADPHTLYHDPVNTFVAGFIGSPPINLMSAPLLVELPFAFSYGDHRVPVPASMAERLAPLKGRRVLVGVRPEDLSPGPAAAGDFSIPGTVEVCEPLGNETLVYWQTAAGSVISRQPGDHSPRVGERAMLRASFEDVHLFDERTEAVLT